jgi:hypothetical protein
MSAKGKEDQKMLIDRLKYAMPEGAKGAESLDFQALSLGQRNPQHCPHPEGASEDESGDPLGEPMTIRDVAQMFGCSEWTVRQQYLPRGLPYFRLSPAGKLLFFHNQIVRWVQGIQRQKGGMIR